MEHNNNRRKFLLKATAAGVGMGLLGGNSIMAFANGSPDLRTDTIEPLNLSSRETRIGMIGLDTSHSVAFTKMLNDPEVSTEFGGYRVVAAYPHGSKDIESSVSRIPKYTEEVKDLGVEIVGSIKELLNKVDVVMLETNDGRLHLEQALPVLQAGKPLFIDKPVAASLGDAIAIFKAAKQYNVPVFSSSSLRYLENAQEIRDGKAVGKVVGADTFSPAELEKTHPDLFWYGVHGVEVLFTIMGTGCKSVTRTHTEDTDVVVGIWHDGRVGTFRGTRTGSHSYGGTAFGEKGIATLGPYVGYKPLLLEIIKFFRTGKAPVSSEETLEIFSFMEAADESKRQGGQSVTLESVFTLASK